MRQKKMRSVIAKTSPPGSTRATPVFYFNALTLGILSLGFTTPNDSYADTLSFTSTRTEDIGSDTRYYDVLGVGNNVVGTVTGAGGTLIYNGGDINMGGNAANTTATLDMGGLSNFIIDSAAANLVFSGRRTGGAANSTDQSHMVITLAGENNTITANSLGVGSASRSVQGPGFNTGTMNLGAQNTLNVDTLILGNNQANGTLQFASGVSDGKLKLRATNGVDAVKNINIGTGINSNYSNGAGTLNTTAGTLDAKVENLNIASAIYGSRNATGLLSMGAGLLEVDTVNLGVSNRSSGTGATIADLNISNGGVVKAANIIMGTITGTGSLTSRIQVASDAMLRVGTIAAGSGNGTRSITLNGGTLANLSSGADLQSAINTVLTGQGTLLSEGAAANMTLSGVVSGAGGVTKTGEGTLELTASNTYAGPTNISQGTLAFTNERNLGTGSIVLDGGNLQWKAGNTSDISSRLSLSSNGGAIDSNGNDLTFNSAIGGTDGLLLKKGDGTLTLTADDAWRGSTQIDQGALQIGNGGTSGNISGAIINNSSLILNRSDVLALTATVSGSGNIVQSGSGTTVLTGTFANTGGTRIDAGSLQLGDGGTSGDLLGDVSLASGAALLVNRSDNVLLNGNISGDGRVEQNGSGVAVLAGNNSWTGGTTISSGTLQIGNGGTSGSVSGDIDNQGTLQFNRSDSLTVSNNISGSGDVVQAGSGTLILQGDQRYSGATRVQNGTLQLEGSLQSDTSIATAGTLTGAGQIFGSLTNAGTLRPGAVGATDYRSLTVSGDYVGNDGVLALNTWLGGDGSPTDMLILDGGHASGTTRVAITNTASSEEYTTADGIRIIDAINGATTEDSAFRLAGDTRSGALSYRLFRGDLSGTETDSWYLRNQFVVVPVDPVDPVDPTDPTDPTDPPDTPDTGLPTDPTDPTSPVDPSKPVDPAKPVTPVEPGKPVNPGKPVSPGNTERPATILPLTPPPAVLPPGEYPVIGPAVATYGVVQPVAQEMGMLTLGSRDQRGGDSAMMIGDNSTRGPNMWTRLLASEIDHSYQAFAAPTAKGTLGGLQIGADLWQGSLINGHSDLLGVYVAQSRANISVDGLVTNEAGTNYERQKTGKLRLNGTSLGAYWTHVMPGMGYVDATVQGTRYRGNVSSESGSLDTTGYGLVGSLETGYPFALPQFGPGFTLEPQAQLVWQHTRFDDAKDQQGSVAFGKSQQTSGSVGVKAKWNIETASGTQVQPYASVNYWHDWNGRSTTVYDGKDRAPLVADAGRISTEVGVSTGLTTNLRVQGALGYQTGASSSNLEKRDSYSAGLGLRYSF